MTLTDLIILILSGICLIRGWQRGWMLSLTAPLSLGIATAISLIYFQITKNTSTSLTIALIGPWIINGALKGLLRITRDPKTLPHFLSRLGGSLITLLWGWVFMIFTLILLNLLPPWGNALRVIHQDTTRSVFGSLAQPLEKLFFPTSAANTAVSESSVINTPRTLAQDSRFQTVLQDAEIQKAIDAHDFPSLMKNPKMLNLVKQIMNDPETMKKVLALTQKSTPLFSDTKR